MMFDKSITRESATAPRAGVRHALVVLGFSVAFGAVPYVVPGLEAIRPYRCGGPIPFAGVFEFRSPIRRVELGGVASRNARTQSTEELLFRSTPTELPIPNEEDQQGAAVDDEDASLSEFRIEPEAIAGLNREIEDHGSQPMAHFHHQLLAVARDDPGAMARITVFTVSTNGSDRVTSTVRRSLQERFGDGGKGFLPIAAGWGAQEHRDVEWTFDYWRTCIVNRGRCPLDRPGLAGVMATNPGVGARAFFSTVDGGGSNSAVSRFELFYQAWPEGGQVSLRIDDEPPTSLDTRAERVEDRVHVISVDEGPHQLRVRVGQGRIRLYGVVMERPGPGVVVDGLMMLGASVSMMDNHDEAHLRHQVSHRSPDLLVFWLGGNDVVARAFTHDWFVGHYGRFIARARSGRPEASCLILSVLDKGIELNGRIRTRRRVPLVVEAQRATAEAQGCAFLNLWEAMGGRGTMARWYETRPRLVTGDYGHMTLAGARVVGELIHRALLEDYDDFLAERQTVIENTSPGVQEQRHQRAETPEPPS